MTIQEINNIDIELLEAKKFDELSKIYNGDHKNAMVNHAFNLFSSYNNFRNSNYPRKLEKQIRKYDTTIGAFSKICHIFHKKYVADNVPSRKEIKGSYVEASQIMLTRLQNQYNQLVYRQQRIIAYIALAFTLFFSLLSIVLTIVFQ